jgi:large subunit ribosomal protein L6
MSRVGKKLVAVPAGVTVKVTGRDLSATGPKGTNSMKIPSGAQVVLEDGNKNVRVNRLDESKQSRANHGLTRALIANLVRGVEAGFERRLQIYGTGYNCSLKGKVLHLNIGYSGRNRGKGSQFELPVPAGLEVTVERDAARGDNEPAQFVIRGVDRQKVGQFAAEVHSLRRTEPYKGKGIRYEGEVIKKKQGKALTAGG